MKKAKLPVGIIGLGRIGYKHANTIISKVGSLDLVAASDVSRKACERIHDEHNIKTYDNYHELLDDPLVKGVVITTPTSTHVQIAKDAINKGKYVFCEKPTSDSLKGAKQLSDFVKEKNAFLQVGFMMRFYSGHVSAKLKIEEGQIGEPKYFQSCGRDAGVPKLEFIKKSGGLIFDMMIHDLDLARWYLESEPVRVYAQGANLIHKHLVGHDIDEAVVILDFEDNKMAVLEVSRNCGYGYDARHEVIGTEGAIVVGPQRYKPYSLFKSLPGLSKRSKETLECDESRKIEEYIPGSSFRYHDAYIAEFSYFAECALNDKKPDLTAFDSYMALKICDKANESLKKVKPVKL
jgi:scyllo-inositol 2-dehydrogenase (NAD+)